MTTYVVTGANGHVGRRLVGLLADEGNFVIAVTRKSFDFGHPNVTNINTQEHSELPLPVGERVMIDLAWSGSAGAERSDIDVQLSNLSLVSRHVELASELGCSRYVGIGTSTQFENELIDYSAGDRPGAGFLYGAVKTSACDLTKFLCSQKGLNHNWVYLGNTFTVGDPTPKILYTVIDKTLAGEQFTLGSTGEQFYDFVDLDDAVRQIKAVADHGASFTGYYVGSGEPRPLRELFAVVEGETLGRLDYSDVKVPSVPRERYLLDESILEHAAPQVSFREGVARLVESRKGD